MSGILRKKPYIWLTWLTPLLAGENVCEWKVWMKAHYQDLPTIPDGFDSAQWKENHTALLTKLRTEYATTARTVLTERSWKIEGRTATVAGKIDLVTLNPNLVIDAKSGKQKDSHITQVKGYLLAIDLKALNGISGDFKGVVRYSDHSVEVPGIDEEFKERFFGLVRRLAGPEMEPTPSLDECKFCNLADCPSRISEESMAVTTEF